MCLSMSLTNACSELGHDFKIVTVTDSKLEPHSSFIMADAWLKGLRGESANKKTRKTTDVTAGEDQQTPRLMQDTRRSSMPNAKPVTNAPAVSPLPPAAALKPPLPSFSRPSVTPRTSQVYLKTSVDGSCSLEEGSTNEDTGSEFGLATEEGFNFNGFAAEGESVQVMVRVRPCNAQEIEAAAISGELQDCLKIPSAGSTIIASVPGREAKRFTYDKVLPQSCTQEDIFEAAGIPMVDNVLAG